MDFTILYRVLIKPSSVFNVFKERTRPEPFIFIAVIVIISGINAYRNDIQQVIDHPILFPFIGLFFFFVALLSPGINALATLLFARLLFKKAARILPLLSAFILCDIPIYISVALTKLGYSAQLVGLGGLFTSLKQPHPFAYGILSTISIYFVWVIILWRSALAQILSFSKREIIVTLLGLILLDFIMSGLLSMFAVTMFNQFNPGN